MALAASSGTLHFPSRSPEMDPSLLDLISTMLIVDPKQRPFVADVLRSVEALNAVKNPS